jgi:hypothetical protein
MLLFAFWLVSVAAIADSPIAGPSAHCVPLSHQGAQLWIPDNYHWRTDRRVDLLVHFHGDPATVCDNARRAGLNVVILTVNYRGLSSAYVGPFRDPQTFAALLAEALASLHHHDSRFEQQQWDRIAVSSFSAGYGAIREILKSPDNRDRIAAVLLADSLYASTSGDADQPLDSQMVDFKRWATEAAAGHKTLVVTHSSVATPGYQSTRSTADALLRHLDLEATPATSPALGPLAFERTAQQGNFWLWGVAGDTGEAHMLHLRQLSTFMDPLPLARHR